MALQDFASNPEIEKEKHLAALNDPIKAVAEIAHPFGPMDLAMGNPDEKGDVFHLTETKSAYSVGDNHVQAILQARFPKPDGSHFETIFSPLFMKKDSWEAQGAVHIVEARSDDALPKNEVNKPKKGNSKKVNRLNNDLTEIAETLPGKAFRKLDIPDLDSYTIHEENKERFVTITANNTKGESFPVILNTMDHQTGMQGHIFVARHPNSGDFAFLDQPKPVVGQKKIGPPQGFAGPLEKDGGPYKGLRDEMGIDLMSASLQQLRLEEDLTACLVDDTFFLLHLNKAHEDVLSKPDLMQNMETQLDMLAKVRMSPSQTFEGVADGKINGAHAVAGIALSAFNRGDVIINPNIDSNENGLLLKRLNPKFDPKRERLSLSYGSVNAGQGNGEIYSDPTKFRDITPIRVVKKGEVDITDTVFASWHDIYDEISGGISVINKLGVVETAAIFTHGLRSGIFIPNL